MVHSECDYPERRKQPRTSIQLPIQFYELDHSKRLAVGATLNIGPSGVVADVSRLNGLFPGKIIAVKLGIPAEPWQQNDGSFEGRVVRVAEGSRPRCAVEVIDQAAPVLFAPELVGKHSSILAIKRELCDIAACNANVLIRGESGTGKNLVAKLIHRYSPRSARPNVKVNCPSIPESLVESELFGHERGAFTDAKSSRPGLFRLAHGGTLVLDEISAVPPSLQAKLLQAIEEKSFIPLGGSGEIKVDLRIIATSNDDLEQNIRFGSFRKDLFYRINEVQLTVPPLRERKSDIGFLADHLLRKYCQEFGRPYAPLSDAEMGTLSDYSWPGNVRELENMIKRSILIRKFEPPGPENSDTHHEVEQSEALAGSPRTLRSHARNAEIRAVMTAMRASSNNRTEAAAILGISYRTLLRKIKKYQIQI